MNRQTKRNTDRHTRNKQIVELCTKCPKNAKWK